MGKYMDSYNEKSKRILHDNKSKMPNSRQAADLFEPEDSPSSKNLAFLPKKQLGLDFERVPFRERGYALLANYKVSQSDAGFEKIGRAHV